MQILARWCVPEYTLTHSAIEYAMGNSGDITYSAIVFPLRKNRKYISCTQHISFEKNSFQVFYKPIFFANSNSECLSCCRFFKNISGAIYEWTCQYLLFILPSYFFLDLNQAGFSRILVIFTAKFITSEPFELGSNARPFWNPEKECQTEVLLAESYL